jgi:hypothetical protein
MPKTVGYHADAVEYNRRMAEVAERLSADLTDETVVKWCAAIGKQHRAHERRHDKLLGRVMDSNQAEYDGGSVEDSSEENDG